MRLAILSQSARAADAIGGQIAATVRAARNQGWDVRVLIDDGRELHPDVASVAWSGTWRQCRANPAERAWLRAADLVVVEYGGDFDLLELLPVLGRGKQRLLFVDHGVTPTSLAGELRPRSRQRGYVWLADGVVVHSRFIAEELHEATGYPIDRATVLPCCLPGLGSSNVAATERRSEGQPPTLLFVGRLAANKRLPVLIEAAARLTSDIPGIRVVAVGRHDDCYAAEAERCRSLATRLGVDLILEGAVSDHALRGWLARAAALIVPSVHEGFGLPIVEGLAAGVPVLVARAGASPATLGDAGLSFEPDDPVDLAATLRRVLQPTVSPRPTGRFAIVSPRWGRGFAGGAERSLATIARTLVDLGRSVEVFTTCNEHDHLWRDTLPAGTTQVDGLPVHRYPCDPTDTEAFQTACAEIRRRSGRVASEVEAAYLAHSLGSEPLVAALCQRRQEFDAILVGPYLFRLTWQVATAAPEQTLVLPCFHDEPFARLAAFRQTYSRSAALICHSEPELHFMTEHLGLNHPRSYVVGTTLSEKAGTGEAARGQARLDSDYLVYCGRWSAEKGADKLTAWMSALHARQPGRVRLVVMGGGSRVPTAPWLVNLGFVDEATKRDVLAGARALVQLSPNESLSLVVLECWAEGRPVIVDRASAVLAWQVARSGGGWAVGSAEEFEAAAMACLDEPVEAQRRGGLGQQLARREYQDTAAFGVRWETILEDLRRPLAAIMSERGPCRAERFTEAHWRPRWLEILGRLRTRPRSRRVELRLPTQVEARPDDQAITVPVRVCHRGTATLAADGPGRHCFFLQMRDPSGRRLGKPQRHSLRQPLLPGQEAAIALPLPVPSVPGQYEVEVWIGRRLRRRKQRPQRRGTSTILIVSHAVAETSSAPALRTARRLLAQAQERHQLPDDYVDVTEGRGASLKRYIKRKLLNNLRRAYIDVLSRQQSEVNADLINCLGLVLEQMELLEQEVARLRRERGRSAPRRPRRRSSSQEKEVLP